MFVGLLTGLSFLIAFNGFLRCRKIFALGNYGLRFSCVTNVPSCLFSSFYCLLMCTPGHVFINLPVLNVSLDCPFPNFFFSPICNPSFGENFCIMRQPELSWLVETIYELLNLVMNNKFYCQYKQEN